MSDVQAEVATPRHPRPGRHRRVQPVPGTRPPRRVRQLKRCSCGQAHWYPRALPFCFSDKTVGKSPAKG